MINVVGVDMSNVVVDMNMRCSLTSNVVVDGDVIFVLQLFE